MAIVIFLLGTIIGSFLNVCIYRIPKDESIIFPGSHCANCSTPLKWYDLIPVLSFLFLRGKCRYCGDKISLQYPVIELLSGIIFLIFYYRLGLNIDFIYYTFLFSIFIIIVLIDCRHQIIPNSLVLLILIGTFIYRLIEFFIYDKHLSLFNYLYGLLISVILFLLIFIISKGGIGGGDIKLIGVLGFILGFPEIILNIFLSFLIGAIISVFLLAFRIKNKKDPIPFGPFIILGFVVTFFWGEIIIDWYMLTMLR